jgi:uncharacterized SAM-binding protein YcdF (DUF218 family)
MKDSLSSPLRQIPQRGGIIFRFLFFICFLFLLFLIYLARRPLLGFAGGFWVVNDKPEASDAIVILGDDNYGGDRATRAAQLFKDGMAPRIVASGRYLRPYATIAELEQRDLTDHGVPAAAIVRFDQHAGNTKDEAAALTQLISSRGWKRILLVTSNYHTRRARYICERIFPAGTIILVVAAPDSEYDPHSWWHTRAGQKIFAHECAGMLLAIWEMRDSSVRTSESTLLLPTPHW